MLRTLKELSDPKTLEEFVGQAAQVANDRAGAATAAEGFGVNSGIGDRSGDAANNADAWLNNANWPTA